MLATPWFTCFSPKKSEDAVKAEDRYPECETCINRIYDQDQCEDCVDGDNYEPGDDEDDFFEDDPEDMTIEEFKDYWRNAA